VTIPLVSITDYPESWYAATAVGIQSHPRLEGERRADVCVIGAGYTGLSAALHLAERGYAVVVLEAARVGWGASGRNGGQMGSGQRRDQQWLEDHLGVEHARRLWDLAEDAKALVKERVRRHAIACDLRPGILHAAHRPRDAQWYARYTEKLQREYNYPHVRVVAREEMAGMLGTTVYHGGNLDSGAGHLHPLNFALGLARAALGAGAEIFEHSAVTGFDEGSGLAIRTGQGVVRCDHAILACNGYLGDLAPPIAGTIMPINNFIAATEPLGEERARSLIRDDVAVADSKFVIDYFRLSADHRLLFGGGENYSPRFPRDIAAFVRPYMLKVYPQLADVSIEYAWGGTLAITLQRMPHFGRLSSRVLYAHGYSGHGVAMATLAGELLAEATAGQAERFDVMARVPAKRFPGGAWLRHPALVLGMMYYALRDRL